MSQEPLLRSRTLDLRDRRPRRGRGAGRRDHRRAPCSVESLESRTLLTIDYLYSLHSRPGITDTAFGIGNSVAASAEYHIAGHVFGELRPDASGFAGEVQIHDAQNGALLRTIVNPEPEELYTFGHSVAIAGNLLVVGAVGRGEPIVDGDVIPPTGPFSDLSGRAYLYNADTGALLHTFHSSLTPGNPYSFVYDSFGAGVAIAGDYVVVTAPGFYLDDISSDFEDYRDDEPGRVYVFSASTGDLLRIIENPIPTGLEGFGYRISIADNRLLVASPFDDNDGEASGAGYLFDIDTGALLHTFVNPDAGINAQFGAFAGLSGDTVVLHGQIPVGEDPIFGTPYYIGRAYIYDADTGDLSRVIDQDPATPFVPSALAGTRLISTNYAVSQPPAANQPIALVHDVTTGELVDAIFASPTATIMYYSSLVAFDDRLLFSNYLDGWLDEPTYPDSEVAVYDLGGGTVDPINPPTDLTLDASTVVEGSAVGTLIGTLSTIDADPGETFTYTLVNSAAGRFAIVGDQLVVADGNPINYESSPTLHVIVQVADSDGHTYSETFEIQITNVNEAITDIFLLDPRVVEHAPDGALVAAIDNPHPVDFDAFGEMAATATRLLVASGTSPEAYILDAGTFEILHTLINPNPGSSYLTLSLAINDTYAIIGNPFDDELGPAAGAVHVYDVSSGDLIQTIRSTSLSNATFGTSVAIFGDLLAVGASLINARVFVYDLTTGNLVRTLESPLASKAGFGAGVAMDAARIAVGQAGAGTGSVHLFSTSSGAYLATIENPTPAAGDFFGDSLAMRNGTVLVGDSGDNTVAPRAGAAYLFDAATGTLLHTFLPIGPDLDNGGFGFALDFASERIAIGSASLSRTFLYHSTTYDLIRELPDVHFGDESFGVRLAFGGSRLFVGDRATRAAAESGEIQVFDAITGDLLPAFRVVDGDATDSYTYTLLDDAGGRFALDGDQLVVANGAAIDHATASSHAVTVQVTDGAGHTFTKSLTIDVIAVISPPTDVALGGSSVAESSYRAVHNLDPGLPFGRTIATDGVRVLIAENQPAPQTLAGRVRVLDVTTGETLTTLVHPAPTAVASLVDGAFGGAVAVSGDLAVIAASYDPVGGLNGAGRVYVFNASTGTLVRTLQSPSPHSFGNFGWQVAVSGDRIAVAEIIQGVTEGVGTVYLYSASSGALLQTIANPQPNAGDRFGTSLALDGGRLLISANGDDTVATNAGRAYLYQLDPATSAATLLHSWSGPLAAASDAFGSQVALGGELAAITQGNTLIAGVVNSGLVHIFNATTGAFLRTIANPDPADHDFFGTTLGFAGEALVAGVASGFAGNDTSGHFYVFDPETGARLATIANPSPAPGDRFGAGLAAAGGRIVASALGDDSDGPDSGLVYIFDRPFGQTVGTLTATDPDPGETFTYTLLDNADGRFAIRGDQLIVADATKLNFETTNAHNVTVQVADSDGVTLTKTFTIQVTNVNDPPRDIAFAASVVPENAATGTLALSLTAIDPDFAGPVTYILLDDAGGRFAIAGATIVVANGTLLDYEASSTHRVTVRATDAGGASVIEVRTITLTDMPDTFDLGDLPDSYGTTLAANGARHVGTGGLWLGSGLTLEADGLASAGANADASDDGVTGPALLIPGLTATFTVTASQAGWLDAFLDFNGNGTFEAAERVTPASGHLLAAGVNTLSIAVPTTAAAGAFGARFRISSAGGLDPIGAAADGEVEDYRVTITSVTGYSTTVVPDPDAPGSSLLLVNGTGGPDVISVQAIGGTLRARINGTLLATVPATVSVSRIVILGGAGNDRIRIDGTAIPGHLEGGDGHDTLTGGNGPDRLFGGGGRDTLDGRGGNDAVWGGLGNDILSGGLGIDYLFGEEGNDRLSGHGVLSGGGGSDVLSASGARNVLIGGTGADRLFGARARRGDLIISDELAYEVDIAALRAIREEWASPTPVSARIGHLSGTTTGGLNGPHRLASATVRTTGHADLIVNYGSVVPSLDDWIIKSSTARKPSRRGIVLTI